MRKSRKETAKTRERIVKKAAHAFMRDGIAESGLLNVMASAGLTQGGFYRHFASKDQLVSEAVERILTPCYIIWRRKVATKRWRRFCTTIYHRNIATITMGRVRWRHWVRNCPVRIKKLVPPPPPGSTDSLLQLNIS
jgi:AcrR family transcriptional regulator